MEPRETREFSNKGGMNRYPAFTSTGASYGARNQPNLTCSPPRLATRGAAIATAQSGTFVPEVLAPALPESPFELRFFSGAVKINSRDDIITGLDEDPVKNDLSRPYAVVANQYANFATSSTRATMR